MQIENMTFLVTGGASGMGAATAKALRKRGAKVALLDMNKEAVEKMATEIDALPIVCDVTSAESVASAITAAEKAQGKANGCIICAGIVHGRRMVNKEGPMPLEEFERVINVNVIGTFNVMRLAAASMMDLPLTADGERGIIITTASVAAFEGQIGQTAYGTSKGAVASLTLPAARELASAAIRVMCIAPGLVDTPMFAKISPVAREALADSVPFPKRLARPEEYAMLACHIIENPMLNGEIIRLDGALRMAPK